MKSLDILYSAELLITLLNKYKNGQCLSVTYCVITDVVVGAQESCVGPLTVPQIPQCGHLTLLLSDVLCFPVHSDTSQLSSLQCQYTYKNCT